MKVLLDLIDKDIQNIEKFKPSAGNADKKPEKSKPYVPRNP